MAADPETLARYEKRFGYLHGRSGAAPLNQAAAPGPAPALSDLAASSPAVRTAFERAGILAPSAAPAPRAPRPAPALETAGAPWDSVVAKITSEVGLDRGGATFKHATPSLMPHPTCVGAASWESVVAKIACEARLDRGAMSAPAAPRLVPHPTCPGASTWESIVAKVCHEAGIPDTARGRAKRE
jgi:hypothetical protein